MVDPDMMCDDLCIFSQVFFSKEFLTNSGCCLFTTPITEAISFCLPWHVRAAWSFRGALSVQKLVMPQKDPLGKHTQNVPWIYVTLGPCSLSLDVGRAFWPSAQASPRVNLQTIMINMGIQAWNSVILVMLNWLRKSWVLASRIWHHDLYNELWTTTG